MNTPASPEPAQSSLETTFYTPLEVAALCGLSRRRVYDWLSWGWLRGGHHGGRWLVAATDWEFFQQVSRGARGRLMPSLHDWETLWQSRPLPLLSPSASLSASSSPEAALFLSRGLADNQGQVWQAAHK